MSNTDSNSPVEMRDVGIVPPSSQVSPPQGTATQGIKRGRVKSSDSDDEGHVRIRLDAAEKAPEPDSVDRTLINLPFSAQEQASIVNKDIILPKQGMITRVTSGFNFFNKPTVGYDINEKDTVFLGGAGDLTIILPLKSKPDAMELQHKQPKAMKIICSSAHVFHVATSSAWKSLFDDAKNNKKSTQVVVPEMDPTAFLFILRVAHHAPLPKSLSFSEVVKIARLCYNYRTIRVVKDKIRSRIMHLYDGHGNYSSDGRFEQPLSSGPGDAGGRMDPFFLAHGNQEWMFVAWAFALKQDLYAMLIDAVKNWVVNDNGMLCNGDGKLIEGTFPQAVIGFVLSRRRHYLSKLLDLAYTRAAMLLNPKNKTTRVAELCGMFLRGLGVIGLEPMRPDVKKVELTVNTLYEHLLGIWETKNTAPASDARIPPPFSDEEEYEEHDLPLRDIDELLSGYEGRSGEAPIAPRIRPAITFGDGYCGNDYVLWAMEVNAAIEGLDEEVYRAFRGFMDEQATE